MLASLAVLLTPAVAGPPVPRDVLTLTAEGRAHEAEVAAAIGPVEMREDERGRRCFEGVVELFPVEPGAVGAELRLHAHDPGAGLWSETVALPAAWLDAENEVDTLRDLGLLFGFPPEGERIGGRSHVRRMADALKAYASEGDAPEELVFRGAALRWADDDPGFQADLDALLRMGGSPLELPRARGILPWLEDLAAVVAAERRSRHLEPGFERAALALLRGWIEAAGEARRLELGAEVGDDLIEVGVRALREARSGVLAASDPAAVAEAFEVFSELSDAASYRELSAAEAGELHAATQALDLALDAWSPEERNQRRRVRDPRTAVDPSELALVWVDVLRATGALRPGATSEATLQLLAKVLHMHCIEARRPDPRRNDQHDLQANLEQLAAELFDPFDQPDAPRRRALFDAFWGGVFNHTLHGIEQAQREAVLLGIAGWGTPSELDERAERLFREMENAARKLVSYTAYAQGAEGDAREQALRTAEQSRDALSGWLVLARAMAAAGDRDGANPGAAMQAHLVRLRDAAEQARESGHPDAAQEHLLERWDGGGR